METQAYGIYLEDDGTLDTVVEVYDKKTKTAREYRYATDLSAHYRDESGCLDLSDFAADVVIPDADCDEWPA